VQQNEEKQTVAGTGQQNEEQQPAAEKGQQPAAKGSRTRGSNQLLRTEDRGAFSQTPVTLIFLAVSLDQ
jgi:hypothetical protein